MTTRADIDDFPSSAVSPWWAYRLDPKDFSRGLFRDLCACGYEVVPVNLLTDEIDGHETFQCLQVIRSAVEGVADDLAEHDRTSSA